MTRAQQKRIDTLLPDGKPRWVRIYDNGGTSVDRYTVVYTGKYRKKFTDPEQIRYYGPFTWFVHLGMSAAPFHPHGVCTTGESMHQVDVDPRTGWPDNRFGKRIKFEDLNQDCQQAVLLTYVYLWNLPTEDEHEQRVFVSQLVDPASITVASEV